jgi:hypothetical protein
MNRRLRDVLKAKGYDVSYTEVPNAVHNYEHWRAVCRRYYLFDWQKINLCKALKFWIKKTMPAAEGR